MEKLRVETDIPEPIGDLPILTVALQSNHSVSHADVGLDILR